MNTHYALGLLLYLVLISKTVLGQVSYHPAFREEEMEALRGSEHIFDLIASKWQGPDLNPGLSLLKAMPHPFQCSIPQVRTLRSLVGTGEVLKGANQALGGSVDSPRKVHRGAPTTLLASHPSLLSPWPCCFLLLSPGQAASPL